MAEIRRILCDMDGVLCAFFEATLKLFDFDIARYPNNEWEIAHALGISNNQFWHRIEEEPHFWLELHPYPWKDDLLALLKATGVRWTIATSPSLDHRCPAQKVQWMRRHIDPSFKDYMIGSDKYLMARDDALLIDDSDANVSNFIAAGGNAILFPQRWNSLYQVSDPFLYVATALKQEFGLGGSA